MTHFWHTLTHIIYIRGRELPPPSFFLFPPAPRGEDTDGGSFPPASRVSRPDAEDPRRTSPSTQEGKPAAPPPSTQEGKPAAPPPLRKKGSPPHLPLYARREAPRASPSMQEGAPRAAPSPSSPRPRGEDTDGGSYSQAAPKGWGVFPSDAGGPPAGLRRRDRGPSPPTPAEKKPSLSSAGPPFRSPLSMLS